jgi:hypothetical protein
MKRNLLLYNSITLATGILLYLIHTFLINQFEIKLTISLPSIYLFFTIASIFIITSIELIYKYIPASVGYAFLVGIFLKMGIFVILFFAQGMSKTELSMTDKFSILLPLFVFMGIEIVPVIKSLKTIFKPENEDN